MSAAVAMVRHRFASFAGTFVAVALGVAVLAGSATLHLNSQPVAPARYDDAPVLVQPATVGMNQYGEEERPPWTAADATKLAARLAELPGVAAAVPDPAFYVQRLTGGRATGDAEAARVDGHSWSSAQLGGYRLTAGQAPGRTREVALAGVAPGTRVEVLTAAGPESWTVSGTVDGPGFYVADSDAFRRAPGVPLIGLTVTGDEAQVADAARALLSGAGTVRTGAERDKLEATHVTRIRWIGAQLLIALVTLSAFATIFVVSSTCALSAAQRRRELGLLRAVGATPGQVRRQMYAETTLIALLGGLVGAPLGALTAPLLAAPMVDAGLEPAGFTVTWQPLAVFGAALLGVLVALCGVAVAARRASRVPPLDALREAAVDPRAMTASRWVSGLLGTAAGGALLVAMPSMPLEAQTTAGLGAAMLLLSAATLLSPVLIGPLVRLVAWPVRRTAIGMLVREGTLTGVRRVAATAAPVLATVGLTVLLTGTIATIEDAAGIDEAAEYPAANLLVPDGTPGLTAAAVAGQPGESRLETRVLIADGGQLTSYYAAGVAGAGPGAVLAGDTATELGVEAGSTLAVRWPDGSTSQTPVRAIDRKAPAPVVFPADLVRERDPAALTSMVVLDGDATAAPGATTMTVAEFVRQEIDEEGQLVDLFLWTLIGLTAGYTGIAVANTLLMATAARRGEFGALRLAGAGTGQVLRVVSAESLLAVVVGALLGGAVAGVSLLGVRAAVESELDQKIALVIPWPAAVAVTTGCAVVAVVAAAVPVLRRR
ncbi:FtsX-like permease family protein [Actinoplanes sp. NBC_00393]|uniref:FtsX-like permease family protein n=1 Tax=Actinoplanes sp. NBC_00393 TaxID=2975953 RepID=UPI002E1AD397